jgi:hypothetical protein
MGTTRQRHPRQLLGGSLGTARRRDGCGSHGLLIRPDGYVSWVNDGRHDLPGLRESLTTWCGPGASRVLACRGQLRNCVSRVADSCARRFMSPDRRQTTDTGAVLGRTRCAPKRQNNTSSCAFVSWAGGARTLDQRIAKTYCRSALINPVPAQDRRARKRQWNEYLSCSPYILTDSVVSISLCEQSTGYTVMLPAT